MAIKGLTPQLAERGKIKIGGLGEERKKQNGGTFMLPVKYDCFHITTMQRDAAGRFIDDKALMSRLMEKQGVQKLLEIPVRLLYDDIDLNCQTRYSAYAGSRCWCSGDGEWAERFGEGEVEVHDGDKISHRKAKAQEYGRVACPCEHLEQGWTGPNKCKPLSTLQVLLEGVDRVGGVWKFRSTSWNTVNAILSSLALIKTITGGPLAGIPLVMVLSPKTVSTPDGKSMVAYIVSLEYRGPEEQLAEIGYEIAKRRIERQVRMESVEAEARKLLVAPHQESAEEQEATAAEFYPGDPENVTTIPQETKPASPEPGHGKKRTRSTQSPGPGPEDGKATGTQGQDKEKVAGQEAGTGALKPKALTLPEVMELVKNPDTMVDLPIPLETRQGVPIGRWLDWTPNLSQEMVVYLEMVDNLEKVTKINGHGLTADLIKKSFSEAGITVSIVTAAAASAETQEGQERLGEQEQEPAPPAHQVPKGNGGGEKRKSLF